MVRSIRDKFVEKIAKGITFVAQMGVLGESLNHLDLSILYALRGIKLSNNEVDIQGLAKNMNIHYNECWKSIKKLVPVGKLLFTEGLIITYRKNKNGEIFIITDENDEEVRKIGGRSIFVRITDIGESILDEYVYLGENDKSYRERLIKNIRKKNPKLIKEEVVKELFKG